MTNLLHSITLLVLISTIMLCGMFCGCSPPQKVVATVDAEQITIDQVRPRLEAYDESSIPANKVAPERQTQFTNAKSVLTQLINECLLLIEARRQGIIAEVDKTGPEKRREALRQVLSELGGKVTFPSYKEAYDYYERHPDEFSTEPRYQLEHLILDTEDLAWKLKERLEKRELSMAEAARRPETGARSAYSGNERLITVAEMPAGVAVILPKLKLKQISQPVATPYGYHLIRIKRRLPAGSIPFSEVENRIKDKLFAQRLQQNYQRWLKQSREHHTIKIYHQHLTGAW
ncbi:MAG: peptidyl-prolyl cis-trans isomerase [Deltaproteobacteria bacterium]|nr:peptidyl-prolyl cis-trans isomerase [Deltaproteobacteria bacterium]